MLSLRQMEMHCQRLMCEPRVDAPIRKGPAITVPEFDVKGETIEPKTSIV